MRVLIHGLGVEGQAALRHFRSRNEEVLTFDAKASPAEGAASLSARAARDVLGSDTLYLRSPGVPLQDDLYQAALGSGATVTTPTGWWLATLAPAGTITITGTKGKSTTSALCADALRAAGMSARAYGNIGAPVLDETLPEEAAPVVELSSYMAADLLEPEGPRRWRHALTNLYKEHTTWHGTEAAYRAAKLSPWRWSRPCAGTAPRAVIEDEGLPNAVRPMEDAAQLDGAVLRMAGRTLDLSDLSDAFLSPGLRYAARAAAAILAPVLDAATLDAIAAAGVGWTGLPSRQAQVPSGDGRFWIDDALATVPEAVDQALDRFGDRCVRLVLGGKDRGQDLTPLLARIATLPDTRAYGFGEIAGQIEAVGAPVFAAMEDAVRAAQSDCDEGGIVLFSPAAPSGPPHADYKERSAVFAALAQES